MGSLKVERESLVFNQCRERTKQNRLDLDFDLSGPQIKYCCLKLLGFIEERRVRHHTSGLVFLVLQIHGKKESKGNRRNERLDLHR